MDIVKSIGTYCMKIKNSISPPPPPKPNEANLTFMTCLLKVDIKSPGWQKAIMAILRSNKGVRSFQMSQNGKIMVTGKGDLNLLLKMLKKAEKSTELVWVQSGLCSSNLFLINGGGDGDGSYVQQGPRGPFDAQPCYPQPASHHHSYYTSMPPPPPAYHHHVPPPAYHHVPPPAYHHHVPPPLEPAFGVDNIDNDRSCYLQQGAFRPANNVHYDNHIVAGSYR
ncbi:unnamed protein product [Cuscuta epithymum]|uniref:HMA domain-containing protein n=2 Tax=Cuscuta epithymum TaxID=186058 RepID=A0AAV0FT51_9ASTE|nr:unnamed protein product [Cuscuta epithymum]